jgi:uncharacterized membrane protein YphA (DoxX/SURF4 family)
MSKVRPPAIVLIGRVFFATGMIAFGVLFVAFAGTVSTLAPAWPGWLSGQPWGYVAGAILAAAGFAILLGIRARTAALLLGSIILLWDICRDVDWLNIASTSLDIAKALALGGGAFVIAGTFPRGERGSGRGLSSATGPLDRMIPLGRFMLAPQMIIAGTEHFIYARFVYDLVPAWIPGHPFWTYFTGAALIAGGLGLLLRQTARLAAGLLGAIIFVWVLVLHLPRAFTYDNANEWTSVFQALAMSGIAFILAATPLKRPEPAG